MISLKDVDMKNPIELTLLILKCRHPGSISLWKIWRSIVTYQLEAFNTTHSGRAQYFLYWVIFSMLVQNLCKYLKTINLSTYVCLTSLSNFLHTCWTHSFEYSTIKNNRITIALANTHNIILTKWQYSDNIMINKLIRLQETNRTKSTVLCSQEQ